MSDYTINDNVVDYTFSNTDKDKNCIQFRIPYKGYLICTTISITTQQKEEHDEIKILLKDTLSDVTDYFIDRLPDHKIRPYGENIYKLFQCIDLVS